MNSLINRLENIEINGAYHPQTRRLATDYRMQLMASLQHIARINALEKKIQPLEKKWQRIKGESYQANAQRHYLDFLMAPLIEERNRQAALAEKNPKLTTSIKYFLETYE